MPAYHARRRRFPGLTPGVITSVCYEADSSTQYRRSAATLYIGCTCAGRRLFRRAIGSPHRQSSPAMSPSLRDVASHHRKAGAPCTREWFGECHARAGYRHAMSMRCRRADAENVLFMSWADAYEMMMLPATMPPPVGRSPADRCCGRRGAASMPAMPSARHKHAALFRRQSTTTR